MSSPLHKVPTGLLELYRLRTLGHAPNEFSDTVIPTVESLEAYAAPEMQTVSTTPNIGAINAGRIASIITVANFTWLWGIGANITMGAAAGTWLLIEVGVMIGQSQSLMTIASWDQRSPGATFSTSAGVLLPKPLVLRAGSQLYARVSGDAGGADHSLAVVIAQVPAANLI